MRDAAEPILTVVEVLIHDPLYRWALTMPQALSRQAAETGAAAGEPAWARPSDPGAGPAPHAVVNADAERALLRIRRKLRGTDGGEGEVQGPEGQALRLLGEAMNGDNLARMYVGWAAWV